MKRLFFVLLLLCISFASATGQCIKIDSLRQLLLLPSLSDTSRINVMNHLGREYLTNKQTWAAEGIAQQTYALATTKNYKVGMGDALLLVGDLYFQSEDIQKRDTECIPKYTEALKLYTEAGIDNRMAIAYRALADYYYTVSYQKNEYQQQAIENYLLYLNSSEKAGNKASLAEAYERVGYLYETLGEDAKSTQYFLKVINLRKEIEEKDVNKNNPHLFSKTQKFYNLQIENQRLYTTVFLVGAILFLLIIFFLYMMLNYRHRANRLLQKQKEEIQVQKENIEVKSVELAQQNEEILTQRDQLADQTKLLSTAQIKIEKANEMLKGMNQQLEGLVAQRTEQLQKSNQMLIDSNRELDTLIYRASHDFKGPVATLAGLSYIGKLECIDFEPALEVLDKIEDVARKMDKMLEKLHQVSYIIGKDLEPTLLNIRDVVEDAKDALQALLEEHPIQIEVTIAANFELEADPEILQMMLENIIENSVIYQRQDALPALHIIAESDEHHATLIFEDNGLGIESKFLIKAFEMFSRGSELAKGNGLGLYVVKQGLERMLGTETIQSVENVFTRIVLTFDKKKMVQHYRLALLQSLDWAQDE